MDIFEQRHILKMIIFGGCRFVFLWTRAVRHVYGAKLDGSHIAEPGRDTPGHVLPGCSRKIDVAVDFLGPCFPFVELGTEDLPN